jgi:hypothetical protein
MLTIEDGTGLSNAQSYIDVAGVTAYFTLRGNAGYIPADADIIKAMDYLESVYSTSFIGEPLNDTQALSFPRVYNYAELYPIAIKNAVCELALKASVSELMPDTDQRVTSEAIGSIKVTYAEFATQQKQYSAVYNILKPYLSGSLNSVKVSR